MTVSSSVFSQSFVADGIATDFPFSIQSYDTAWIQATVDDAVVTFSVALNEDQESNSGGIVTFDAAPDDQAVVRIYRTVPLTQLLSLPDYTPFPARNVEDELDKITMALSQFIQQGGSPLTGPIVIAYGNQVQFVDSVGGIKRMFIDGNDDLSLDNVFSVSDPTEDSHAATKGYVDENAGYPRIVTFSATGDDDDLQLMTIDADGYTSVSAVQIDYLAGEAEMGTSSTIYNILIDGNDATGGTYSGMFVQTIDADNFDGVVAIAAGAGVGVAAQLQPAPLTITVGEVEGVDELADLINPAATTNVFVNNNETLVVGAATTFDELAIILNTGANKDLGLTFEYSTGIGTWDTFTPNDNTNGFQNSGILYMNEAGIPSWSIGDGGGNYLIRLTRTVSGGVSQTPIVELLDIHDVSLYSWDKDGILSIARVIQNDIKTGTLVSPPSGMVIGETWADTTDDSTHPILRRSTVAT